MRRFIGFFGSGFVMGAVFGAIIWYLFSPLLFDEVVSENLDGGSGFEVIAGGILVDADGAHRGTGEVTIVRDTDGMIQVQLSAFEVTNGPDLEVWLSAHPDPQSSSDVKGEAFLSLGQLKGNVGDQAYYVPMGEDLSAYKSLVIWCEQFGVLFSPAVLTPRS
jgi:hypothetical protein